MVAPQQPGIESPHAACGHNRQDDELGVSLDVAVRGKIGAARALTEQCTIDQLSPCLLFRAGCPGLPRLAGLTLVVLIAIGVIKGKLARLNLLRTVFAGASQQTPRKSDYC